jgi:chromosome segregation ATPase
MSVSDFFSHFFSWGDVAVVITQRMNDFTTRLDALTQLLTDIKGEQQKMALDWTKLSDEITRIAGIREKLAADVAALRAGMSSPEDQAKVDEFATSLHAELDALAAVTAEPAPAAPADAPVDPPPAG